MQANDFVGSGLQILTGNWRADWNGDDNFGGALLTQRGYRCSHGRAGGKSVIDQNDGTTFELRRGPIVAIVALPPFQFLAFNRSDHLDDRLRIGDDVKHILVQNANAAGSNRAHGEFFVTRHAKFAHDKNIEGHTEPLRDLKCDRHTSTRQTKNNNVVASGVPQQFFRELPTRISPVLKNLESKHGLQRRLTFGRELGRASYSRRHETDGGSHCFLRRRVAGFMILGVLIHLP